MQQNLQNLPESFFQKLVDVIKAENHSLSQLQKNLELQYQVLLNHKLSDFLKVLEEQKVLLWETKQKEDIRQQELQKLIPFSDDLSLQHVLDIAPAPYKRTIKELKKEFDLNVEEIEQLKSRNQILIQKSLDLIQKQISALRNLERKGYNAKGIQEQNDISFFSRKI